MTAPQHDQSELAERAPKRPRTLGLYLAGIATVIAIAAVVGLSMSDTAPVAETNPASQRDDAQIVTGAGTNMDGEADFTEDGVAQGDDATQRLDVAETSTLMDDTDNQ